MYRLVAFDAYGTLFDVYSLSAHLESLYLGQGERFAQLWRDRQIEYTRLVTLSDPNPAGSRYYQSFWDLTQAALRYVAKRLKVTLSADAERALMDRYATLACFADSQPVLQTLKASGVATGILSNGSRQMLSRVVEANGLTPYLDHLISVDDVRLFKTAPQAYARILQTWDVLPSAVLFVSSNAWDVLAARWFGFDVFWVNRAGHPYEEIGEQPHYEGRALTDVLGVVNQANSLFPSSG